MKTETSRRDTEITEFFVSAPTLAFGGSNATPSEDRGGASFEKFAFLCVLCALRESWFSDKTIIQ